MAASLQWPVSSVPGCPHWNLINEVDTRQMCSAMTDPRLTGQFTIKINIYN